MSDRDETPKEGDGKVERPATPDDLDLAEAMIIPRDPDGIPAEFRGWQQLFKFGRH